MSTNARFQPWARRGVVLPEGCKVTSIWIDCSQFQRADVAAVAEKTLTKDRQVGPFNL
jgi:hypothetical protein